METGISCGLLQIPSISQNFMQSALACTSLPGISYQHRDHHSSPAQEPSTQWLSPHQPNAQTHLHHLLRLPGRREPSSNKLFLFFWRSCSSSHEPGTASEKGRWLVPSWEKYWESSASELTDPCWRKVTLVTSCHQCAKPLPACEHHTLHSYCCVNKGSLKPIFKTEDLSVYWGPNCWNWRVETLHINTFLANTINEKGFQIPLLCRCGSVQKQGIKLFTFAAPFIHVLHWEKGKLCTSRHSVYGFLGFTRKTRFFHCNAYTEGLLAFFP